MSPELTARLEALRLDEQERGSVAVADEIQQVIDNDHDDCGRNGGECECYDRGFDDGALWATEDD